MDFRLPPKIASVIFSYPAQLLYSSLTYFVLALASISVSKNDTFATIWFSNAILLLIILRREPGDAWGYLITGMIANAMANYVAGISLLVSIGFSLCNLVELLPAIYFFRNRTNHVIFIDGFNRQLAKLTMSILVGCILSSILGAALVYISFGALFVKSIFLWFSADVLAMLMVIPFGLSVSLKKIQDLNHLHKLPEIIIYTLIALFVTVDSIYYLPSPFVIMSLPLIFIAFRLNFFETSLVCVLNTFVFLAIQYSSSATITVIDTVSVLSYGHFLMSMTLISPLVISLLLEQRATFAAQLFESEQRWSYALEGGGQGVWDWNPNSEKVYYSRTWKTMLGYEDSDIGDTVEDWSSRVHPEDYDRVMIELNKHLDGHSKEYVCEYRLRCKNEGYKWILVHGKAFNDKNNNLLRVIGTHTDIDVLKKTEEEHNKLMQRLLLTLDAGKVGIFELNLKDNSLIWDEQMCQLYGIANDAQIDKYDVWNNSVHPDDYERVINEHNDSLAGIKKFDTEFRIINQSNVTRYIRAKAVVLRSPEGEPLTVLGMNWDITREKTLSMELYEEKERLHITLHSIGDSVIVTDKIGCITYINPAAEKLLESSDEQSLGKQLNSICKIVFEASDQILEDPIMTCLNQKKAFSLDRTAILITKTGARHYIHDSTAPLLSSTGDIIGAVLVLQDETENHRLQRDLKYQATHDMLTGLHNRREFENRLSQLNSDSRQAKNKHCLFFLDLDRFKIVNDTAGHAAGDELLRKISDILEKLVREGDVVSRLGGDEFAILLPECSLDSANIIASKIINSLKTFRFVFNNKLYEIGVSIGLVEFNSQTETMELLISHADEACYTAKHLGGNTVSVFVKNNDATKSQSDGQILTEIKEALVTNGFRLFMQETRPLRENTNLHSYYEILIRMVNKNGSLMMPSSFIGTAERHNLMISIDEWVVNKMLIEYGNKISQMPRFSISINLSQQSINSTNFLSSLRNILSNTPIPKSQIGFELTEIALINNQDNTNYLLSMIQNEGCFVTLDNFGTGLTSFKYLQNCPVKCVKIDGNLIKMISQSDTNLAIVESIHQLSHKLGACSIAEHVENKEIMEIARNIGIDYAQGYFIGKATPLDEVFECYDTKSREEY